MKMKQFKKYLWPLLGIIVMLVSFRILYVKLKGMEWAQVFDRLGSLDLHHWLLAIFFAIASYAALAGYDRIALKHLGKKNISWLFITICSFTTYALSHNIGASVFSGAVVRYRAYSKKGLSGPEIAVLVGFCSFTFALGTIVLSGLVLVLRPELIQLFHVDIPNWVALTIGFVMLGLVGLYILGSILQFKPLKIGKKFQLTYPRLNIVVQQLIIGPLELLGAAGIIYAVLPDAGNPGFITVLGVFLASFSVTLLSTAPAGGLGVLETIFIAGMPNMGDSNVIAALIVFRLLYLIIPLFLSLIFIAVFEFSQLGKKLSNGDENAAKDVSPPS
ncbi:lysylphosphatidylglycerol synthase domain-containing protein [Bartonella sp. HY761]|nr:YbhN family protein [Bartonella sp. HY761]UXN05323.1 lysylphosphatidylglycerol synthase domain-containing protein [Bartonella sp. HY761]